MPTKTAPAVSSMRDDATLATICGASRIPDVGADFGAFKLDVWLAELRRREREGGVPHPAMQSVDVSLLELRRCVAILARGVADALASEAGM